MRQMGILGGSFNPIHNGHLHMAKCAAEAFHLTQVLLLPTGNPPHKREGLAPKEDRMAMVRLAAQVDSRFCASDAEMRRTGTIYTIDTLLDIQKDGVEGQINYIIGADTLLELHTWKRFDEVLALCAFIVCMRPGVDEVSVQRCLQSLRGQGARISLLDMPPCDISSTEIRKRVQDGRPLTGLVPASVEAYIAQRGLYKPMEES